MAQQHNFGRQAKGGMDVSDDEGSKDDPPAGGAKRCTSDDVVAAMLEVRDNNEVTSQKQNE